MSRLGQAQTVVTTLKQEDDSSLGDPEGERCLILTANLIKEINEREEESWNE